MILQKIILLTTYIFVLNCFHDISRIKMDKIMRTDPKQSDENREEAGLEEALKLWMEIRQVDRKKVGSGWRQK